MPAGRGIAVSERSSDSKHAGHHCNYRVAHLHS
jgi:hypothetical protein